MKKQVTLLFVVSNIAMTAQAFAAPTVRSACLSKASVAAESIDPVNKKVTKGSTPLPVNKKQFCAEGKSDKLVGAADAAKTEASKNLDQVIPSSPLANSDFLKKMHCLGPLGGNPTLIHKFKHISYSKIHWDYDDQKLGNSSFQLNISEFSCDASKKPVAPYNPAADKAAADKAAADKLAAVKKALELKLDVEKKAQKPSPSLPARKK